MEMMMRKILTPMALNLALVAVLAATVAQARAQAAPSPASSQTVLRIDGISTPACPGLVKSAVRRLAGILKVDASLEHRSATVEFDAGKTSVEEIRRVIKQDVGFDSEVRTVNAAQRRDHSRFAVAPIMDLEQFVLANEPT
jgi:copper chaperone CopZ